MKDAIALFTLLHDDHGIEDDVMDDIKVQLVDNVDKDGFFIYEGEVWPESYHHPLPCALYGPAMDDEPINEEAVHYSNRGLDREWEDRMIDAPLRYVSSFTAIGTKEDNQYTLYTVYGGPLAPQHPDDPSNQDVEGAKQFWSEHALATGRVDPMVGINYSDQEFSRRGFNMTFSNGVTISVQFGRGGDTSVRDIGCSPDYEAPTKAPDAEVAVWRYNGSMWQLNHHDTMVGYANPDDIGVLIGYLAGGGTDLDKVRKILGTD